jgi:ABC-type transport system substrate-binding protein
MIWADPPAIFYNDPATEIKDPAEIMGMFTTGTSSNILGFSNPEFDTLVSEAENSPSQPGIRQELYIQAERILAEQEAIIIPLYHHAWQSKEYSIHYAEITSITIDDQGRYVVEYQTYNYTPQLDGEHVHFFFNTVPPDQAGRPSAGPWIMYYGPSPFTEYGVSDRPHDATQMCILVANPDHSVQPGSGNCVDLP